MKKLKRIEFFIIKKCLNNCVFCSEKDRFNGEELDFKSIQKVLCAQRRKGVELVHFMGGEPTIHPDFVKILAYAKSLGLVTHIITNGLMFSERHFAQEVLPLLDEIMVSIHGHNARTHELNTRNPCTFKRLMKAMELISEHPPAYFAATTSITKYNCDTLLDIAKLVNGFSVNELQFISVIPSGEGKRNYLSIVPRLKRLQKSILPVAKYSKSSGLQVRFAGIPMCILKDHYMYSSDLWEEFKVDNTATHDDSLKLWKEPHLAQEGFTIDIGRIKPKKCAVCFRKDICGGVYQKYYMQYGDHELTPVRP